MRFPAPWIMELVLVVGLAFSVILFIVALQAPQGDHTRFTLERSEAPKLMSERRLPLVAEETALGR